MPSWGPLCMRKIRWKDYKSLNLTLKNQHKNDVGKNSRNMIQLTTLTPWLHYPIFTNAIVSKFMLNLFSERLEDKPYKATLSAL